MKRIITLSLLAQLAFVGVQAQKENAVLIKSDTLHVGVYDDASEKLGGLVIDISKDPRAKYNWFVDASVGGGTYVAEYTRFGRNFLSRMQLGAQLGVGKWILPHWAIRFGFGYNKFSTDNSRITLWNIYDQADHFTVPAEAAGAFYTDPQGETWFKREFQVVDAQIDIMYDLNSAFTKRVTPFDTYIYAGLGYVYAFPSQGISYNSSFAFKLGFQVNYNVTKNFYIKAAIEGTINDESLDGSIGGLGGGNRTVEGYAQGFLGVGFNFGKKKINSYPYKRESDIDRTYEVIHPVVTEDYSAPFVVRFFIDQYNIEADQELNISKVCKYLQAHPQARLLMTGHCDPETATPEYNQALSERRCNAVLDYIDKHYGISHDRIDVKPMGDTERNFKEDFRWNRCVILTIIDK